MRPPIEVTIRSVTTSRSQVFEGVLGVACICLGMHDVALCSTTPLQIVFPGSAPMRWDDAWAGVTCPTQNWVYADAVLRVCMPTRSAMLAGLSRASLEQRNKLTPS